MAAVPGQIRQASRATGPEVRPGPRQAGGAQRNRRGHGSGQAGRLPVEQRDPLVRGQIGQPFLDAGEPGRAARDDHGLRRLAAVVDRAAYPVDDPVHEGRACLEEIRLVKRDRDVPVRERR
jgi:hypothetical protein